MLCGLPEFKFGPGRLTATPLLKLTLVIVLFHAFVTARDSNQQVCVAQAGASVGESGGVIGHRHAAALDG